MTTYIIRRLIQSVFVLLIVTILVFFMMRLLPGDPVLMYLSKGDTAKVTPEQLQSIRQEFGLDRPLPVQYVDWLGKAIRGDLGISIARHTTVASDMAQRVPVTLYLGILSFFVSLVIGIPAGIISAVRRGKWVDTTVTTFANLGIAVPVFWLGLLLLYVFALQLKLLPVFGYTSPFEDFGQSAKQALIPVICLAAAAAAGTARQTRSAMLEVMHQDYIRTAWSKGLTEWLVIARHALKNSLIPVVTLNGLMLRNIIGGSVLIETVFGIPGMGRLAVESIRAHDYPVIQGIILIISITVMLVNLLVDLSYGWLDPRIRYD